jgi:methylenetetrahydrofolate reductase (NADPH)
LLVALKAKSAFATSMTTQLCFDAEAIGRWIEARRADGLRLQLDIGLPGVAPIGRLISISARIGVTDSARFLGKNRGLVGRLLRPGGFRPDGLLEQLSLTFADPVADVRAIHFYTFNQVGTTESWRRRYLAQLGH